MYVRAAALHRRSPPLSAVLPSEGRHCAVADALLPRRPRLVLHGEGCGLLLGFTTLALYVSLGSLFYACPSLKCPVGLCYMDTGSDECLGFLRNSSSHFPGLCRLVLTCSHDSLFPRYAAIDIVWRGPVFLALGFLRHLALRGSTWWSPGPGWCSHQSFSRTLVLPFLTLTHALTVYDTPLVVSALTSNLDGEFVTVLCLHSHHCLRFHRPVVSNGEELGVRKVPSSPSHTGTSVSCPSALQLFGSVAACLSPVPPDSSTHG